MMSPEERKEMRRRQVEQCLSTTLTIREWCKLNGVAESTMFYWMARFRKEESDMFDAPSTSQWIEFKRSELKAKTALAKVDDRKFADLPNPSSVSLCMSQESAGVLYPAIVVSLGAASVAVPSGTKLADMQTVLKAVVSL